MDGGTILPVPEQGRLGFGCGTTAWESTVVTAVCSRAAEGMALLLLEPGVTWAPQAGASGYGEQLTA